MRPTGHTPRHLLIVLCLFASGCDRNESLLGMEIRRVERAAKRGDLVEVADALPGIPREVHGEKLKQLHARFDSEMARIVAENYDALTATMLDGGTLMSGTDYVTQVVPTPETVGRIIHLMEGASAQRPEVAKRWPQFRVALERARDKSTAEHEAEANKESGKHDDDVRNRVLFVTRGVEFQSERQSCLRRLQLDVPPNWLHVYDSPSTHDKELAAAVVTLYEEPRLKTQIVKVNSTTGFGRGALVLRGLKALTGADKIEVGTITAMNLKVTVTAPNAQKRSARWDVVLPEADQPAFAANNPEELSRVLTQLWQGECERLTAGLKLAPAK